MGRRDERQEKRRKRSKKSSRRRHDSDSESSRSSRSGSSSSEDERTLKRQRKRSEKVLASFGYTNETNPFGDSNLSQPFVWRKKYEEAPSGGDKGGSDSDSDGGRRTSRKSKKKKGPSERELKRNQLERVEEIRKARARREQREKEKEEMERLRSEEMRLKDAEQYVDWQKKEEEFHLEQTRVRSKLRIKERREKPVDLLAKNLLLVDRAMDEEEEDDFYRMDVRVEKRRPHAIVEVLSMDELDELKDNILAYLDLERSRGGRNMEFWELMMVVTRDRIHRLRKSQREERERGAIHDSVNETIHDMLHGKSQRELSKLKVDVEKTVESAATTPGIDVEFWEEVSQQIDVYKARARLAELHDDMLDKLRDLIDKHDDKAAARDTREAKEKQQASDAGAYDDSAEARAMEFSEADKGLEESEEKLGAADEVALTNAAPAWSDKYQPRKPRYFNRVKTGYDWNKYNQTHYDHDNPPPKVVQGYKFNLFYPDLIDKTSAPRYVLEKTSSPDFCIIRFTAGPPYQDIAFKIVNREWEHSHKRGFKSVFERGILHLYFNFKRHRYRR